MNKGISVRFNFYKLICSMSVLFSLIVDKANIEVKSIIIRLRFFMQAFVKFTMIRVKQTIRFYYRYHYHDVDIGTN